MSDAPDPLDGLNDLAACDLRLAKRFAARIEALPQDADDKAMSLARAYQRMARSYRQSIALHAKLRRDLKAEARDDDHHATRERRSRISGQKAAIKAQVRPLIWNEHEAERAEQVDDLLYELVEDAAERPDFLDHPLDTHVAALTDALGLAAPEPSPACGGKRREAAQQRVADGGSDGEAQEPILFSGRLAPPRDIPPWADDDSS